MLSHQVPRIPHPNKHPPRKREIFHHKKCVEMFPFSLPRLNEMRVGRLFLCTQVHTLWRRYSVTLKYIFMTQIVTGNQTTSFAVGDRAADECDNENGFPCVCLKQQVNNDKIKMPLNVRAYNLRTLLLPRNGTPRELSGLIVFSAEKKFIKISSVLTSRNHKAINSIIQ